MQFAYIDEAGFGAGLIGSLLSEIHGHDPPEEIPEVQLPGEWIEFRETLLKFQQEYAQNRRRAYDLNIRLKVAKEQLATLNTMASIFTEGSDLKVRAQELIEQFEIDNQIPELSQELGDLKALSAAQKTVLENTNAEQQVKFQCFVCMERCVDLCLDPCGHVLCQTCWTRLPTTDRKCPGCRATPRKAIKIFTL
jgi:hypothetical protein